LVQDAQAGGGGGCRFKTRERVWLGGGCWFKMRKRVVWWGMEVQGASVKVREQVGDGGMVLFIDV
jgi:hypothetical protein